jgi:hypothetical protein
MGDGYDISAMNKTNVQKPDQAVINVSTKRMDEIIQASPEQHAYLIKVDVQGFEPQVFQGLKETIMAHKVDYILFEYWPKGIDLMSDSMGECKAVAILEQLAQAGYHLYALAVVAHPLAPKGWQKKTDDRPFHDFTQECKWLYQLEERNPSDIYRIGYWTDILAVAPGVSMSNPISGVGRNVSRPFKGVA